jgi:hypothetical protein
MGQMPPQQPQMGGNPMQAFYGPSPYQNFLSGGGGGQPGGMPMANWDFMAMIKAQQEAAARLEAQQQARRPVKTRRVGKQGGGGGGQGGAGKGGSGSSSGGDHSASGGGQHGGGI